MDNKSSHPYDGTNKDFGKGDKSLEVRTAKMEISVERTDYRLTRIETELRDLRNTDLKDIHRNMRSDFRFLSVFLIAAVFFIFVSLMAKGFGWI